MEDVETHLQTACGLFNTICNTIRKKETSLNELNEQIQKKQQDIESYNKVSWIKKMNKQFEDSKKKTIRLEKQNIKQNLKFQGGYTSRNSVWSCPT